MRRYYVPVVTIDYYNGGQDIRETVMTVMANCPVEACEKIYNMTKGDVGLGCTDEAQAKESLVGMAATYKSGIRY